MMVVIKQAELDDPKQARIEPWGSVAALTVSKPTQDERAKLSAVIDAAYASNRSPVITFDAASGAIEPDGKRVAYSICTAALDEIVFRSRRKCVDGSRSPNPVSWRRALPNAIAEAEAGDVAKGRAMLDAVLDNTHLPTAARALALDARISALEMIGESSEFASAQADQAHFAALQDSRLLGLLRPTEKHPASTTARLLSYVGDYDGASAALHDVIKRFPEEREQASVSLAVVARQKGDLASSLRLLNEVAANDRGNLGMRYFYHRGWTLLKLDLFDEAIASFDEGMDTQADFSGSFILRGCARSSVGQLDLARDDFDHALMLMERFTSQPPTAAEEKDRTQLAAMRRLVSDGDRRAKRPGLCNDFAGLGDQHRAKSKLLD